MKSVVDLFFVVIQVANMDDFLVFIAAIGFIILSGKDIYRIDNFKN